MAGLPVLRLVTHVPPYGRWWRTTKIWGITVGKFALLTLALIGVLHLSGIGLLDDLDISSADTGGGEAPAPASVDRVGADQPTDTPSTSLLGQVDRDGDGLSSNIERKLGTDPTEPDTDGDRLLDGWEANEEAPHGVQLNGSDPNQMDLHLKVTYTEGIHPLSAAEKQDLRAFWREMPVENPDGTTGIQLHIEEQHVPVEEIVTDEDYKERRSDDAGLAGKYYTSEYMGEARCQKYQVVFAAVQSDRFAGYASSPGYWSVVDGKATDTYKSRSTHRVGTTVHEVLHNVIGEVQDDSIAIDQGHTTTGWLSQKHGEHEEYLPDALAAQLEEHGFAESRYYESILC